MQCKVDGCEREAMYKSQCVCQKHYFRMMRYGTYELVGPKRRMRIENQRGYQKIFSPGHRLANSDMYAYEHRLVVYEKYGENLPCCELCGKPTNWATCHIDHKDNNVKNNDISNLRPVCRPCNTRRGRKAEHTYPRHMAVTIGGVTMTPHEWSQLKNVHVHAATIRRRIRNGSSHREAVYGVKRTHKNTIDDLKQIKAEYTRKAKEVEDTL